MKTFIFYVFYSENKKKYYSVKSDLKDLIEVHKIIKRRILFSEKNIIDLDFETNVREENKIKIYNKFGNLDFLGEKYKSLILKITYGGNQSNYYEADKDSYSQYHLDIVEINSFLSALNKHYEKELLRLRKSIKITWLFG
jgi:hypothetical protein